MRTEQAIFDELAVLCTSKGFIHAIAFLCFRDNTVKFKDELEAEDMAHLFSDSRLIRTEMTTLIGLMMRSHIDFTLPPQKVLSEYIEHSEKLLVELHQAMLNASRDDILESAMQQGSNPFTVGEVLREPIFYGGESAYTFQYRDLAPRKYRADTDWLLHNKNIDMEVARDVCRNIAVLLDERLMETLKSLENKPMPEWTLLPGFAFSCEELAALTGHSVDSVRAVVEAFTVPERERNGTFTALHEFNVAYSYPFIRRGPDKFILLQYYGISEALYETPFYWMCDDEEYTPTALQHRGVFVEAFAAERLAHVFGSDHVFKNVEIFKSKGEVLGEIDVLVCFGNRAIVLQAKSKKLTLEARKGNDRQLQRDFKAAIQGAVDQAFECAELLGDPSVTLRCRDGKPVLLSERPRTIFPVSVVADHYPALAFQARQFLNVTPTERIVPPLVTDVFTLDTITEMLTSPLRLLSYLDRRADIGDKMMARHETILLSYHLKKNLWLENDVDLMMLHDDISAPLDVAMAVRRDGIPGEATPDGILTRFAGTPFAKIIAEIESKENTVAIDLGFMLLELSESTVREIDDGISQIMARTMQDGNLHDFTIGISSISTGLTIHCSWLGDRAAELRLRRHCEVRKYSQKASTWFGLAMRPDGLIQFAIKLIGAWRFQREMEDKLRDVPSAQPLAVMARQKLAAMSVVPVVADGSISAAACSGGRGRFK